MSAQEQFIEIAKQYEANKEERKLLRAQLDQVAAELGVGSLFQDPETGAVYKIVEPSGTYVEFRQIDYKRTALAGEKGGTVLSKKEAEEAGFVIPK